MGLALLILLLLLIVASLPLWRYSRSWGHRGSGLFGLLLGILDILLLTRQLPLN